MAFLFAAALASSALALDEVSPLALAEVLLSGVTSVLEPLIAAWLIWRVAGEAFAERAPPLVLAMLVAVPVAAFAAAAPLAVGELSDGVSTARAELGFLGAWYSAAVADLMGMLVLTPPIWIWLRSPRGGQIARPRAVELLLFAGAAVAVFAMPDAAQARYLLVAIHLAVALRFPLQWSAASVGLTSLAYLALAAFAGREQPLQDIYAPFLDNVGFVIVLNLASYVTALIHIEAQRRLAQVSELADHLGQAEERERQRISKLLHDDLQQLLVAAKLGLGQMLGRADRACAIERR